MRCNCFYSAGWTFVAFNFCTLLACFWSPSDCKKIPDIALRSIELSNNFRFARYRSIFFGNHCSSIARQEKITFRLGSPDQNKQTRIVKNSNYKCECKFSRERDRIPNRTLANVLDGKKVGHPLLRGMPILPIGMSALQKRTNDKESQPNLISP